MSTDSITYRAAVAEALMREHQHGWHDAFETAEAISPTYMVEGVSPEVAALLWIRYTTRTVTAPRQEPAARGLALTAQRLELPYGGHMPSSYAYTSGPTRVLCATLLLSDGKYCGNFIAIGTAPDGHREIHERTCPGWSHSLDDALTCARALAESIYPPAPAPHQ